MKKDFCKSCQCGNAGPCNKAVDRIYAIQGAKKKVDSDSINVGCPWFINSLEHNYSFWKYAETLDEPVPDKDICNLLLIDTSILNAVCDSAIRKLRELKNTPELQDFREALLEKIAALTSDNSVHMPDEFISHIDNLETKEKEEGGNSDEADLYPDKPKKIKRIGKSMPLHLSGKRIDIYFGKTKRESFKE